MTHTEEEFIRELREFGEVKEDGDFWIIDTIDSTGVHKLFRQHGMAFAIRSSNSRSGRKPFVKPRIVWTFKEIAYFGVPFRVRKTTHLECKLGSNYKDSGKQFLESADGIPVEKKQLRLKFSAKIGCPALMKITEVITFPDYKIPSNDHRSLHSAQTKLMASLHSALKDRQEVRKEARYTFMVNKAYVHNHPIWELTARPTGNFWPKDTETVRSEMLYEQTKRLNWVPKSEVMATSDSLKEWVMAIDPEGDVIQFYKEAGTESQIDGLKVNDFVLIFFNKAQMDVLREFAKKCICIDSHVLNACNNFLMTSLTVVDDMKLGLPIAFMFSSRVDVAVLEIFYRTIRTALGGVVESDLLVTDMDTCYYRIWASVMSPVKHTLYSAWSVDKDWCENLTLITDDAKQSQVYKNLLALLEETDQVEFNVMFEDVCRWMMDDAETREFGTYFIEHFGSAAIHWAECCRQEMGIDFKHTLERTHNTLQNIILQGRNVKTIQSSVQEILHFSRDKILERSFPKRKIHSITEIHHKTYASTKHRDIHLDKEGDEWVWKSSSDEVVARIVKFNPECKCLMKCIKCYGCTHMFICSCVWSSVYWNMCKHIHMLCNSLDLPSVYSLVLAKKAESAVSDNVVPVATGATVQDMRPLATPPGWPLDSPSAGGQFAENKRRIADLMKSIEKRLDESNTEGEFEVIEEILQQVVPVADAHKAEAQSKVKVVALEGAGDIAYYKTPEPVAKRRRVDVRLTRQHERVVIQKEHHKNPSGTSDENQRASMELTLGRQLEILASCEEIVCAEEVGLDVDYNELSDDSSD